MCYIPIKRNKNNLFLFNCWKNRKKLFFDSQILLFVILSNIGDFWLIFILPLKAVLIRKRFFQRLVFLFVSMIHTIQHLLLFNPNTSGGGQSDPSSPLCGFWKNKSFEERVRPWFFVTFKYYHKSHLS